MIIAFSFLSLLNDDYKKAIQEFNNITNKEWLHYDVMDGDFVCNKTFDASLVKEISLYNQSFNDVHLMITDVDDNIDKYIDAGADQITFHYEAIVNSKEIIIKVLNNSIPSAIQVVKDLIG